MTDYKMATITKVVDQVTRVANPLPQAWLIINNHWTAVRQGAPVSRPMERDSATLQIESTSPMWSKDCTINKRH